MMVVIAIVVILLPLAGRLFHKSWSGLRYALERAENRQLIPIAARTWQKEVSSEDSSDWRVTGNVFSGGSLRIKCKGRHLVVRREDVARRILLPRGADCRFRVTAGNGTGPHAVMKLSWPARYLRRTLTNSVRIVGCGRK